MHPCPLMQCLPFIKILLQMGHFLQLMNLHWLIIVTPSSQFIYIRVHSWCSVGLENAQPCVSIIMVSEYFRHPANPLHSANSSLFTSAPGNHSPSDYLHVLSFLECHVVEIVQCVAFWHWLLSLSINTMHLIFLHVFSWLESSFLFIVK